MRKHKRFFFSSLLLMCFLLYFLHYYFNFIYNWNYLQIIFGNKDKLIIPSIIVYSSRDIHKENKKCSFSKNLPNIQEKWQNVGSVSLYLYSAYLDSRLKHGNKFVRILAMSKGKFNQNIFCRIWSQDKNSYANEIEVQELWVSSWDLAAPDQYYRPLLLSCSFEGDTPPLAVSATTELCNYPRNILWLNKTESTAIVKKDFAVCLKPLNFKKEIAAKLLEWLEFQFILGVDKISAYVYNLPPHSLHVLKRYEKLGKVVIKYPTLLEDRNKIRNTTADEDIWQKRRYEMMIYNDCFYNHINSHKMVVNLDLDEAIVPVKQDSWKELFKQISAKSPSIYQFASISAANVYFFDSFGKEPDQNIPPYLYMLRYLYRSANFTPPGFAQKSFFLTNNTLIVTNHYALKALYSNIKTNTAFRKELVRLHHYRSDCPPKMEKQCRENYMKFKVKDNVMLKYKDRLIKGVNNKIKEFNLTNLL